jgi:hypothetical protein
LRGLHEALGAVALVAPHEELLRSQVEAKGDGLVAENGRLPGEGYVDLVAPNNCLFQLRLAGDAFERGNNARHTLGEKSLFSFFFELRRLERKGIVIRGGLDRRPRTMFCAC